MVGRHRAELVRYATALLRDAASAEDAVQEAFSRALDALGRYPEERVRGLALRAWLHRITLNVVRNLWRGGGREVAVAEVPEVRAAPPGGREAGLDALAALGALPERQRAVVALRYLSDLTYAEVSAATGCPEATCRTLARRGVARLRLLMSVTEGEGGS
jgi:RNA polymerase sigma-70 factor (ECF subfamily)